MFRFHLGGENIRVGAYRGSLGGLRQRGLYPEDRAPRPGHGHREHLRLSGLEVQ